jgi:hypothetical protein
VTLSPEQIEARIAHALKVERVLLWLGWIVAVVGALAILWQVGAAILGATSWSRAVVTSFGILAATVLSGATAYGSGTNVGLGAARLQRDLTR